MTLFGRKFILAAWVIVAGTVLAAFDSLTAEFVTLSLGIVTAFNTADTLITRKSLEKS